MTTRAMIPAFLILSASAQAADIQTFAPRVAQDGSQTWVYTTTLPVSGGEPMLLDRISKNLASAHWCLSGWEITNRMESAATLIVEGRCKRPVP
jgi:hypothetical protein